jgi:ATP-dependent Clp protease protease subunit
MSKFWEFKAAAEKKGELYLYHEIGEASWFNETTSAAEFQKDLAALGDIDVLDVYINSPGGDVFAGLAIYHMIKRQNATVNVHVDGIAASAASIVAMAGDKIIMPKAATMMIHNAGSYVYGNKAKHRALADELERIDGQLADIYAARTKKEKTDIAAWMDNERWMSGDEALADGFADEVEDNKQIAACADAEKYFARYQYPPKLRAEPEKPETAGKGGFLTPDNGGVSQPVADKTPEITDEQRQTIARIKRKILEVNHNG